MRDNYGVVLGNGNTVGNVSNTTIVDSSIGNTYTTNDVTDAITKIINHLTNEEFQNKERILKDLVAINSEMAEIEPRSNIVKSYLEGTLELLSKTDHISGVIGSLYGHFQTACEWSGVSLELLKHVFN